MTGFDLAIIGVVALSAVIAFLRGIVRSLIGLVAWIAGLRRRHRVRPVGRHAVARVPRLSAAALRARLRDHLPPRHRRRCADRLAAARGDPQGGARLRRSRARGSCSASLRGALVVLAFVLVGGLSPLAERDWWQNSLLAPPFEDAALSLKPWLPPAWAERLRYPDRTGASASNKGVTPMCGIVGVVAHTPVNQLLYDGLLLLQHRGQDAAGIATSEGPVFHMFKGPGSCRTCSARATCASCPATRASATAAIRRQAPRSRTSSRSRSTSIRRSASRSATTATSTNSEQLKRELWEQDFRHVNTNSDSEVLLNVLALELERAAQHHRLDPDAIFRAVVGRAPSLPRRVRGRRDDRGLRSRSRFAIRSASGRCASAATKRSAAANTWSRRNRSRSRRSASSCCATSSPARRSTSN